MGSKALSHFPSEKLSNEELVSVLGTQWHPKRDEITFKFLSEEKGKHGKVITKCSLLSLLARIFDSVRILSSFTITGQIILQKARMEKIPWDQPLEGQLVEEARLFISEIPRLHEL